MAAPIASQVLGEVLPYLEVTKDNQTEEDIIEEVTIPNIVGMTVEDAEKELKNIGLELALDSMEEIDKKTAIVKEQMPKYGIKVYEGTKVSITI